MLTVLLRTLDFLRRLVPGHVREPEPGKKPIRVHGEKIQCPNPQLTGVLHHALCKLASESPATAARRYHHRAQQRRRTEGLDAGCGDDALSVIKHVEVPDTLGNAALGKILRGQQSLHGWQIVAGRGTQVQLPAHSLSSAVDGIIMHQLRHSAGRGIGSLSAGDYEDMQENSVGFVGLGNMGAPMAANLAKAGWPLVVHDAAGTPERAPAQATTAESVAELVTQVPVVLLSLPDSAAVNAVSDAILAAPSTLTKRVIDTSTIGIAQARRIHGKLAAAGIEYVDAPVSGGVAGARAGSVSIMIAAPAATFQELRPLLESFTGNIFHVGIEPGQGQAMKLLNNFLSGTAMAATSEAVAFGDSQGLDLATMLDVLNVSTGRNTATSDKFVNRILTETYDAGFSCTQMNKDLSLYREGLAESGGADPVSGAVAGIWQRFLATSANADITRIYPFIKTKR